MKNNIDTLIEKAIVIGINTSSNIKFSNVKKASKYFHEIIHTEIVEKFRNRIGYKKASNIADYLTEISLLGYTLYRVGIYNEISFDEFVDVIKKNKPLKIIAFELESQGINEISINTEDEISLNAA